MATSEAEDKGSAKRIVVTKDGPYVVEGGVPLVHKTQVVSEHGEPLTWRKDGELAPRKERYRLCRCGHSGNHPFCDGAHTRSGFDGTESADPDVTGTRAAPFPKSTGITVNQDPTLCMDAGFCWLRDADIGQLVAATQESRVRSLVMAMIERCPSGSLTYRIDEEGPNIEPDLPQQVAITTEITSDGPIDGPLWVTGGITIERSDGQPFETRNRVTLCNCGHSANKPLCDGTHRDIRPAKMEAATDTPYTEN